MGRTYLCPCSFCASTVGMLYASILKFGGDRRPSCEPWNGSVANGMCSNLGIFLMVKFLLFNCIVFVMGYIVVLLFGLIYSSSFNFMFCRISMHSLMDCLVTLRNSPNARLNEDVDALTTAMLSDDEDYPSGKIPMGHMTMTMTMTIHFLNSCKFSLTLICVTMMTLLINNDPWVIHHFPHTEGKVFQMNNCKCLFTMILQPPYWKLL